ncbi:MAG: hypothetical protein NT105_02355 [Verrucomicrobia bacterium]|nr:hypothetical protein [Verrucomicrobiota bacterium]
MSRVTAIICGLLLFGLGLFLGMVGSFVGTLPSERPRAPKSETRVVPAASQAKHVARTKPAALKQPPAAVETALSQALAMVAVALAEQPATDAPPAVAPPAAAPVDVATNAPEPHPLDLLMSDTANETARTEPPAAALPPLPEPPSPSPPDPLAGHWVFDQRLGWLWLPENTTSVVVVPMIEVFPGGLITIHAGLRSGTARTSRKGASPSQPFEQRKGSVIQHDVPGSTRKPATSPFPNKN